MAGELLQLGAEQIGAERLDDIVRHTGLDGFEHAPLIGLGRDHHDGHTRIDRPNLVDQLASGFYRHVPIRDNQIKATAGLDHFYGLRAIGSFTRSFHAEAFQRAPDDAAHRMRLVGQQDTHVCDAPRASVPAALAGYDPSRPRSRNRAPISKNPRCTGRTRTISPQSVGIIPVGGPSVTLIFMPTRNADSARIKGVVSDSIFGIKIGGATNPRPVFDTFRVGTWKHCRTVEFEVTESLGSMITVVR